MHKHCGKIKCKKKKIKPGYYWLIGGARNNDIA